MDHKINMNIDSIRRTLLDDILPGEHKWEKICFKYVHTIAKYATKFVL